LEARKDARSRWKRKCFRRPWRMPRCADADAGFLLADLFHQGSVFFWKNRLNAWYINLWVHFGMIWDLNQLENHRFHDCMDVLCLEVATCSKNFQNKSTDF
jgi:hypothetical protein